MCREARADDDPIDREKKGRPGVCRALECPLKCSPQLGDAALILQEHLHVDVLDGCGPSACFPSPTCETDRRAEQSKNEHCHGGKCRHAGVAGGARTVQN
jgi:hypothetical protein